MKKGRLNRLNFRGYTEIKNRLEVLLIVINSNLSDSDKIELIKNHIEDSMKDFKKENGHLSA